MKRLFSHYARATSFFLTIAASFFFLTAATARAQVVKFFNDKTMNYTAGTVPAFIGTGDFDGDGNLDLAVVNSGDDTVSILLGNGDGTFSSASVGTLNAAITASVTSIAVDETATPPPVLPFTIRIDSEQMTVTARVGGAPSIYTVTRRVNGSTAASHLIAASVAVNFSTGTCVLPNLTVPCLQPTSVAVGNFNSTVDNVDLKPDLAITNFVTNEVVILLNTTTDFGLPTAAVNFGAPTSVPVGNGPLFVTAGHFHDPVILDLAVANTGNNPQSAAVGTTVSILKGDGTGAFTKTDVLVGQGPVSIALGHFNLGPDLDFAVANFVDDTVSVFLGGGDAVTFAPATGPPITVGTHPISIAAADFNGDSIDDLAVANQNSKNLDILLAVGDAGGTFTTQKRLSIGKTLSELVVGDFNGDGAKDLAIATFPGHSLSVVLGNGDGTFATKTNAFKTTAKSTGLFSIVAGNFNAGSLPDLAVPNGQVSILLNKTTPPPLGASFTVTIPNGGEILTPIGSTTTITWTSFGFIPTDTVKIDYFDGTTWKAVIKSTPNSGSRLWKVPNSPTAAALIRICSVNYPGICDQSAGVFTIGP